VLCEHHGSDDGYLPSPLILAAAIAGRTKRLSITIAALLLPFYDTVKLAEDMAVLDIISKGRVSYILALGYRPEEFEHFGVDIRKRGRLADEKLALLRELFSGEAVFEGRHITTTPVPHTAGGPTLMWGGGSVAAARRAGRYGLGMLGNASVEGMHEAYLEACREHGHEPGPIFLPERDTPSVCFVADDAEIGQYLLHDVRAYADWNPGNDYSAGFSDVTTVAELRANPTSHRIYGVEEAERRMRTGEMLTLSPLCGGLPPDIAWPYLKRVGKLCESVTSG
jgi:alkanesulfonate monooxygenase SsuD/methylene tetrahydromethanopterin reductase-like flavin-dependent oxidoreductase (luciferase family)